LTANLLSNHLSFSNIEVHLFSTIINFQTLADPPRTA